jgi:2-methylisocitrate lyase-like PEP mutase family enzyme
VAILTQIAEIYLRTARKPRSSRSTNGKVMDEMVAKIRAAVDTRVDGDLSIMARTDALSVNGIDDATERMQRYLEAGADLSFVESPQSIDEMRRITHEIHAPNMANMGARGPDADSSGETAEGTRICVGGLPHHADLRHRARRPEGADTFAADRKLAGFPEMMDFNEFNTLTGLDEIRRKETLLYRGGET